MKIWILTKWPNVLKAISDPMSSPMAISEMPNTATACWDDKSGAALLSSFLSLSSLSLSFFSSFFSSLNRKFMKFYKIQHKNEWYMEKKKAHYLKKF